MSIRRALVASVAVAAVAAAVFATGCQSKSGGAAGRDNAPPLAQQKFEMVKEPEINGDTRFAAGQLAESRNDYAMAIRQYEGALSDRPKDARVINRLAVAYTMTKQYGKAESMWLRYVQVTDNSAEAWNNLAQCYEYANRPSDAEHAYKSAIAADGRNVYARTNYGLMLVRQGKLDDGREQMLAVLPPAEVHYNVASVLEMQGNKTLARSEYLKALELDPKMSDARKRLAAIE
jgi:tetratricopeptide (TPR) repeat protein